MSFLQWIYVSINLPLEPFFEIKTLLSLNMSYKKDCRGDRDCRCLLAFKKRYREVPFKKFLFVLEQFASNCFVDVVGVLYKSL